MVKSDHGPLVPVVQAYAFGKYLGYLNVKFDDQGNVLSASGNPILLDSSIPEGMRERALSLRGGTLQEDRSAGQPTGGRSS